MSKREWQHAALVSESKQQYVPAVYEIWMLEGERNVTWSAQNQQVVNQVVHWSGDLLGLPVKFRLLPNKSGTKKAPKP